MVTPALFLAGNHREASHWARAWGFAERDWVWLKAERDVCGRNNVDGSIVFVCGSSPFTTHLVEYMRSQGYDTFVDAHDHPTDADPRSALDLMPGRSRIAECVAGTVTIEPIPVCPACGERADHFDPTLGHDGEWTCVVIQYGGCRVFDC